jgi:DNA-nicking Smr family endonuclease
MTILQTKRFEKVYKRLHPNQLAEVNKALETVIKNPGIGEQKKGDLAGLPWTAARRPAMDGEKAARLRVYKFTTLNHLTLLGYSVEEAKETVLTFVDMGPHENFYRDLKKRGS